MAWRQWVLTFAQKNIPIAIKGEVLFWWEAEHIMAKYGILGKTMEPSSWDRNIYFHFIKRTFLCYNHLYFRWSSMCVLFSWDKNKIEAKAPTSNWPRSKIMGPMDTASRLIIGRYAIIIVNHHHDNHRHHHDHDHHYDFQPGTFVPMVGQAGDSKTLPSHPRLSPSYGPSFPRVSQLQVGGLLLIAVVVVVVVVIIVVDFIVIPRSHCLMPHSVIEQKNWLILE